ncbi:MAG TPA: diphosphomevalonate decarboxylase [Candidatus Bathyarchaeia archaeon]|nr:diphosphomevalonate decarboxylase [Candidatus Bathyarchaeia archaeon]
MDKALKASARAYAIQGLVKYHGLRNEKLRLPFHDSISVCMKALPTITTVSFNRDYGEDRIRINGKSPSRREQDRVLTVLNHLRHLSRQDDLKARIESRNPDVQGKGLGFSASGFAALGLATARALEFDIKTPELSEVVRLGAGSASRSLAGAFSIWYANRNGRSYAEVLASASSIRMRSIIVPIESDIKTDRAHANVVKSPFFKPRLAYLRSILPRMKRAISRKDAEAIGRLAEEDTLNLHAVTMTGKGGLVLFSPLSIEIIREVRRLRSEEDVPVWFSLDTGPSVFVNTTRDAAQSVRRNISKITDNLLVSDPGGPAEIIDKHLF